MGNNQTKEKKSFLQKAILIKPDYADAYYNMGISLHAQGKFDKAVEAYDRALSLKPDYFEAYNNKGNALKDQGKLEEAISSYKKSYSTFP